jgi:hypothetical protein
MTDDRFGIQRLRICCMASSFKQKICVGSLSGPATASLTKLTVLYEQRSGGNRLQLRPS